MRIGLTFLLLLFFVVTSSAQTIWDSNPITFDKIALDDQDVITENVILTRGESKGIYNSVSESSCTSNSPLNTQWAEGTTADWSNLTFDSFSNSVGLGSNGFKAPVDIPLVLHLVEDNIYIDVKFTYWGSNGDFSYERASSPAESNSESLLNIGPNGSINISENTAINFDGLSMKAGVNTSIDGSLNISKVGESITEGDNSSIPVYYKATQSVSNFQGSISISYSDEQALGFEESLFVIEAQDDNDEWITLEESIVDENNNVVKSNNLDDLTFKRITISQSNASLSIENIDGNKDILVYPNPTKEYITIHGVSEKVLVKIYNVKGREVMKSIAPKINISSLSKGIYILNVKDSNNRKTNFRIIKN